jgi:hypothetical protein
MPQINLRNAVQHLRDSLHYNDIYSKAVKSLLKYTELKRFVTGHDFSRADKANQINRA